MLNIQQNVILAPFTSFKIGGPAKFFCEVSDEKELEEALEYAQDNNLSIYILGGGCNVLVSDQGFNGLIIRLLDSRFQIHDSSVECGSGVKLSQVVKETSQYNLTGLEWASGIPGTVGGAIRGNAGAYESEMKDSVESVKVFCHSRPLRQSFSEASESGNPVLKTQKSKLPVKLRNGASDNGASKIQSYSLKTFEKKDCQFSYRNSLFKKNKNLIILSCVLKLEKGDKNEISAKIKEVFEKRFKKLPTEPSAGSFFENPTVENKALIERFEKDAGIRCVDDKIPAGWLIFEAGLSGKKIGGAKVSEKHGNFIINTGNAKAEDVVILASVIKQKIRKEFNIQLKEEVQYVGF